MWILYALAASLCWGMSYAASGPLLRKGLNPLIFFLGYSLFGFLGALLVMLCTGRIFTLFKSSTLTSADLGWFLFSIGGSALGAYLTYAAMGAKNPTLVSLIEISYPLFVVLFAWLFFHQLEMRPITIAGGLLVLVGVAVIILGEH
jgi:drug/metabolite transporter (DMT)-like permease